MHMPQETSHRTCRIAKNTLMLYIRMLFMMFMGLYTSRIVLQALGESDFGIYNVVGGVVAMFAMISGALNSAVSRFITFEMGKGSEAQLNKVYSTAVTIQLILAALVVAVAEPVGLWFIDNKMTIDPVRIPAARMVLHFSILSFVINLMSVPQMASITAHERMSAYAAIGIMDGLLRFGTALLIRNSSSDRLIYYAALMMLTVLLVRLAYGIYCRLNFEECRYRPVFDGSLMKEMFSFAGWNFIGVTAGVLRDHGGNILVNIFSGSVAVNAARGVALQLSNAVQSFVTNFMTAVNPQITKSYAAGERDYMFSLMRKSSRMAYYLLFIIALPVLFNMEALLELWLDEVPETSVSFARLFLILALSESLSGPLVTGMLATGNIRNYQILVGGLIMLNFPVSYIFLKLGAAPEVTVAVAVVISQICLFARLYMLRKAMQFPMREYLRRVYLNIIKVTVVASAVAWSLQTLVPAGWLGFVLGVLACVVCGALSVLFIGCSQSERQELLQMVLRRIRK